MMKEVAEYFRDLAEQDRFFGAEPPKLDAEMLTILAKRSNQIGIAARTEGTNVVLTPSQRSQDPAPVASAPEAQRIETPIVDHPPVASAEPSLTLEERLQKIRSVVNAKSAANVALQHAIADAPDAEPMDQEVTDTFDENLDDAHIDDTIDETSHADETVPNIEDAIKDIDVETETASTDEPDIDLGADTFVPRNDVDDESARDMGTDALNDDNDLSITEGPVAEDDAMPNTPKPQRQGRVHVIDLRSNNPLPESDDMSFEDELSKALSFDDTPAEPDIKPTQDHIDDTTFDDMFEEDLDHPDAAQDDNAPIAIDEHDEHCDDTVAVTHDFDDMSDAPIMPTRPQITKSNQVRSPTAEVQFGGVKLSEGVQWAHIYGLSCLAGIGFTMSLFIGGLSFSDPALMNQVRLGVLSGSVISALLGYSVLYWAGRAKA
jgi:hypothetical protein